MSVRLFGTLSVMRDGTDVELGSVKQRTVLAALALQAGSVVSSDALIEWVWPDDDAPGSPITSLRSYVSNLRKAVRSASDGDTEDAGLSIETRAPGYVLELDPLDTDLGVFDQHLAAARDADNPAEAARHLDAGLAIASRPFLPEFAFNRAFEGLVHEVAERVVAARTDRIELAIELGEHAGRLAELETMIAEHPFRERLVGLQMRALYLAGRQAESLDAFGALRDRLLDELGLDPSPELQELEGRILRHDESLTPSSRSERVADVAAAPAAAAGSAPATTVRKSTLVGRERELDQLEAFIGTNRLTTVVGAGGVGKTSLVVDIADAMSERFPDGVVVVELAQMIDADIETVADAVAEALGAREQPSMSMLESIVNFLEERSILLVLDNCEHLLAAVRPLTTSILAGCDATILATSRTRLDIGGEHVFLLEPLDPPTHGVELFARRASERDPGFLLDATTRPHVVEVCERLDGIPLAIELAAARVRVLGPVQLAEHLEDRFRLLATGERHGRRESLRDAVLWSYELLDPEAANLFARLAVFSGGFTLESAAEVCAPEPSTDLFDVLDLLTHLVDSSMVVSESREGRVRFTLLETLREFGLEELSSAGDLESFADRHAAHFAALAFQQSSGLISAKEAEMWAQFEGEWSNLRLAFERFMSTDRQPEAAQLALSLVWFSAFAMRLETFSWIDEVLDATSDDDMAAAGSTLLGASALGGYLRLNRDTIERAEQGLALDPTDPGGYCRAALVSVYLNNVFAASDSDALTQEWLVHHDRESTEEQLFSHGMRLFHLGQFEPEVDASSLLEVMVDISLETGSYSATAMMRWAEGIHLAARGRDLEESLRVWNLGIEAARTLSPDHLFVELIEGLVLYFTSPAGELSEVSEMCLAAIGRARNQHHLVGQSHLFGVAAVLLTRAGRPEIGGQLLGAMVANGLRPRPIATHFVHKALGEDYDQHAAVGAAMNVADAGRLATESLQELVAATD